MIALTFDDGPNEPYTRQILEILREFGVKATFFMLGKWVELHPEIAREVYSYGHEIGGHTLTHPSLPQLDSVARLFEILDGNVMVNRAIGSHPTVFRAPFGNIPDDLIGRSVGWDVHGSDWMTQDSDEICKPIFEYLDTHESGIVLLHDGYYKEFGKDRSGTVQAVRKILERYPKGQFCTVSELKNPKVWSDSTLRFAHAAISGTSPAKSRCQEGPEW